MPLFEYKCNKCETVKDKIVAFKDRKQLMECPTCFNGKLEFVDKLHQPGFQLKGDGWYGSGRS